MTRVGGDPRRDTADDSELARDYDELASMHDAVVGDAERYMSLFELAPTPLIVTDQATNVLEANSAASALLDVEPRFLFGKPLSVFVDLGARRTVRALVLGHLDASTVDLRMRRRSGVSFEASLTVRRRNGELYWSIRDRTTEAQSEARVWELNAELERRAQEQAEELRTISMQLPVGVIAARLDGTLAWSNVRAHEIFGVAVPPLDELVGAIPDVLTGRAIRDRRVELESGQVLSVTAAPIKSSNGGVVLVLRDVTERDRDERAHAEFVENAAHQLRTPIAAIAASVAALDAGADGDPDERRRFLAHVRRESGRMASLVEALLTLAGVQRGVGQPVIEVIPLRRLLEEAAGRVAGAGVRMRIECPEHLAVMADRELLREAIGNVVANAADHAAERVQIEAHGEREDNVVVVVYDDGPGVAPEARERVFDRFYRSDGQTRQGSGLGLAIARAAAQATGADLELEPRGPGGAAFRFTVPGARRL